MASHDKSDPRRSLRLANELVDDLSAFEKRLASFSGGLAEFEAIVRSWRASAVSAKTDPAYVERLAALDPRVLARAPQRLTDALAYAARPITALLDWVVESRETTNYTYELTSLNIDQLAWFVAVVVGIDYAPARGYVDELLGDEALAQHIAGITGSTERALISDSVARYSRRIGWYAFVRATKPKVVIETGVDKGLGTCVLAAALLKNRSEGNEGRLWGLDIVSGAGELLQGSYRDVTTLVYGNSIDVLRAFDRSIDLFIHDSDHRAEHERAELEAVKEKMSPNGLLLSDNAHVTSELSDFAKRTSRRFSFFREQPERHFYPGAGIGAAF
jgi:hypothetical protein